MNKITANVVEPLWPSGDPRIAQLPNSERADLSRTSPAAAIRLEIDHRPHYRADIDGLRGVAVLAVLAFHLKLKFLHGGFVGVDVFFVISGYLISAIILNDIGSGSFSIASFYERRARRILPALLFVLLATTVLAYLYFLPTELVRFGKSLLAALFSASNFWFWKQSGYFSTAVDTEPLVHTWSLGIEEQFYLLFPLFLVLAYRYFPRRARLVVILVATASFLCGAVEVVRDPTTAFYLLHGRAWELLLGAIISLEVLPEITASVSRNVAAAAGIAMILTSAFAYSAVTPFPGVAALVPCVGTALVIWAGRFGAGMFHRALSLQPLVFIGWISYSLYLWHWPIIVFQGLQSFVGSGASPRVSKLLCIFLSLVMATLSWRFVEMPFRSGRSRLPRWFFYRVAAGAAALVAVSGITLVLLRGFPSRYPAAAIQVASYLDYQSASYYREGSCFISSDYVYRDFDATKCLQLDPPKRNYLLFGDSLAADLWYGLSTTLAGANVLQATGSGCRPTPEQAILAGDTCKRLMNYVYADFLPKHRVDRLLIAARWKDEDLTPLSHALDWARDRGIGVVLLGPMIQYDAPLPRLLALSIQGNDRAIPDEHRVNQRKLDGAMSALAQQKGAAYISFYEALCGSQSCEEFAAQGVPLQFDFGHLTKEGSVLVAQRLNLKARGL